MQSSSERRRLEKAMADEPVDAWLVLTKCATGLAIVVLLVVLVVSDERVMSVYLAQRAAPVPAAAAGTSAEEHRKQVFAERRQRFQGDAGQHSVASEMAEQSNQLPVVMR